MLQSILSGSIDSVWKIVNNMKDYYDEAYKDVFYEFEILLKIIAIY